MKTTKLSPSEINNAAYNMREIEKCLGRPIPSGYFDAGEYSERMLSSGEAFVAAHNIKELERQRRVDRHCRHDGYTPEDDGILGTIVVGLILAYIVIGMIVEFFSNLF